MADKRPLNSALATKWGPIIINKLSALTNRKAKIVEAAVSQRRMYTRITSQFRVMGQFMNAISEMRKNNKTFNGFDYKFS